MGSATERGDQGVLGALTPTQHSCRWSGSRGQGPPCWAVHSPGLGVPGPLETAGHRRTCEDVRPWAESCAGEASAATPGVPQSRGHGDTHPSGQRFPDSRDLSEGPDLASVPPRARQRDDAGRSLLFCETSVELDARSGSWLCASVSLHPSI